MRILIMCSYYNRPKLVRRALESLLAANEHHSDWVLGFGDDGSLVPGRPIVEDVLKDHLHKVTFVHSGLTLEDKLENGIQLGRLANEHLTKSDAEIALMLCDDDELHPGYLKSLSEFYTNNPSIRYAYSLIHLFNPLIQESRMVNNLQHKYNQWSGPINPVGKVDASQVSWRLACNKYFDAWFSETTKSVFGKAWIKDTDKGFFENLYAKCGDCHPTGIVGQYKGIHDYQLLWHKDAGPDQLRDYDEMCRQKAGVEF